MSKLKEIFANLTPPKALKSSVWRKGPRKDGSGSVRRKKLSGDDPPPNLENKDTQRAPEFSPFPKFTGRTVLPAILSAIFCLLVFAWIALRRFPQMKRRLAALSLASVLLVAVYRGPVSSLFQVIQNNTMSPYSTMLCAAASCANKGLPLSEKSTAIMESVLPIDQWADYYNRYFGHGSNYWGRGELTNEYPFEPAKITAGEAFTVYLEAMFKYPDVVIKDRLDGMDLLWDLRQPSDSFNAKGFCEVALNADERDLIGRYFDLGTILPGVTYYNHSWLSELYRGTMDTATNSVFDMLLWRSGPCLILLMTLALAFFSVFLRSAGTGGRWREQPVGESREPAAEKAEEAPAAKTEEPLITFTRSTQSSAPQVRIGEKPLWIKSPS